MQSGVCLINWFGNGFVCKTKLGGLLCGLSMFFHSEEGVWEGSAFWCVCVKQGWSLLCVCQARMVIAVRVSSKDDR